MFLGKKKENLLVQNLRSMEDMEEPSIFLGICWVAVV